MGRSLYNQNRAVEFQRFLDWLLETIKSEGIELLIVAGDIFDSNLPSNQAQGQYYAFLAKVSGTTCRHVVVIGGNHDSPSFLNAPKGLLSALDVHVVGSRSESVSDEVLVLNDVNDQPEVIVCAVPYLRDRDIRQFDVAESASDKNAKTVAGIQAYYQAIADHAQSVADSLDNSDIPIIATGHLFTQGGKTTEDDGVRDLYVGNLGHVSADIFSKTFDYVALGHLHVPQKVGGLNHIRYCGSPIPMGFGEAKQQKLVIAVEFDGKKPEVNEIHIPCFQQLHSIKGNIKQIETELSALVNTNSDAWIEVIYNDNKAESLLMEKVKAWTEGSDLTLIRVKNNYIYNHVLKRTIEQESLNDLTELQVFERCLDSHEIAEGDPTRTELIDSFQWLLGEIEESDVNAE